MELRDDRGVVVMGVVMGVVMCVVMSMSMIVRVARICVLVTVSCSISMFVVEWVMDDSVSSMGGVDVLRL